MLELLIEVGESFFEVEGRGDLFERDAQLHHRECNFGLNPDDNGFPLPATG